MKPFWKNKSVLITSGPTREFLDPIRFLTNASSGRMGWALAGEAARRGAKVTVVSGPACAPPASRALVVPVVTGLEMRRETLRLSPRADVVIAAAAVSDWRFAKTAARKIKRSAKPLRLSLLPNPDIIAEVGRQRRRSGREQVLVGFALETDRLLQNAREKLRSKGLDMIVANGPASLAGAKSKAAIVTRAGKRRELPALSKEALARAVLREIEALCPTRQGKSS